MVYVQNLQMSRKNGLHITLSLDNRPKIVKNRISRLSSSTDWAKIVKKKCQGILDIRGHGHGVPTPISVSRHGYLLREIEILKFWEDLEDAGAARFAELVQHARMWL